MISTRKPLGVDIVCFIHHINSTNWQLSNHFFKNFWKDWKILFSRSPAWRQWGQRHVNNSNWISKGYLPLFFICYMYICIHIYFCETRISKWCLSPWVYLQWIIWILNFASKFYFLVIATVHLKCFYRTIDLCWGVFMKEEK